MLAEEIEKGLEKLLLDIMVEYRDDIRKKIRERGLVLTGDLVKSVTAQVKKTPTGLKGVIMLNDYGLTWETGISRDRIGAYISSQGNIMAKLESYMRKRNAVNPRAAAFATIQTWYREGAPTRASRRFSSAPGGSRTGFIARSVEEKQKDVFRRIRSEGEDIVLFAINQAARNLRQVFAA